MLEALTPVKAARSAPTGPRQGWNQSKLALTVGSPADVLDDLFLDATELKKVILKT
jgi:hypothetical protein